MAIVLLLATAEQSEQAIVISSFKSRWLWGIEV